MEEQETVFGRLKTNVKMAKRFLDFYNNKYAKHIHMATFVQYPFPIQAGIFIDFFETIDYVMFMYDNYSATVSLKITNDQRSAEALINNNNRVYLYEDFQEDINTVESVSSFVKLSEAMMWYIQYDLNPY